MILKTILAASCLVGLVSSCREVSVTESRDEGTDTRVGAGERADTTRLVDGGSVDARHPAPDGNVDAGAVIDDTLTDGVEAGPTVTNVELLYGPLNDIQLPAVGQDGVSLLQWAGASLAVTLSVDWNGTARFWYERSRAHYLYTAAHGSRHLNLLYLPASYVIYADGNTTDISGTPATYKEFLAANAQGLSWVDYTVSRTGTPSSGKVVFKGWGTAPVALTDGLRYRARIVLSDTHCAFVEYASGAAGPLGQIVVQPLAGGPAIVAAPSTQHQDRPAIDGDWVVWEEYLGGSNTVIRARNLATGDVHDLSSRSGFRTNPDIRGTRVTWEDQRSGAGNLYFAVLPAGNEQVAIRGTGHSTAARQTSDGLVWIEVQGNTMGLMRARWAP